MSNSLGKATVESAAVSTIHRAFRRSSDRGCSGGEEVVVSGDGRERGEHGPGVVQA
eukprot:COSAG02_NODE_691_length_18445_cov_23.541099_4_plen_56_part_00